MGTRLGNQAREPGSGTRLGNRFSDLTLHATHGLRIYIVNVQLPRKKLIVLQPNGIDLTIGLSYLFYLSLSSTTI